MHVTCMPFIPGGEPGMTPSPSFTRGFIPEGEPGMHPSPFIMHGFIPGRESSFGAHTPSFMGSKERKDVRTGGRKDVRAA
jgi:hypothetical protein